MQLPLVTPSTAASGCRNPVGAVTASAVICKVKVRSLTSRLMLHPDDKTVSAEKKYVSNTVFPLYRADSAHGLMVTEPV